jgi:hypothetical protein
MRTRLLTAAATVAALTLLLASAAQAASRYLTRSLLQPASAGLAVKPPLADLTAVAGGSIVVRADWKALKSKRGQVSLMTASSSCRYRVTFSVRALLAAPGSSLDRVTARMPSPGRGRLLDSGQRGNVAWRVTRPSSIGQRVNVKALAVGVLTRRTDIVPSGQQAWTELSVNALSRPGDECHAGTWRALGSQLGDVLATARIGLRFVKK